MKAIFFLSFILSYSLAHAKNSQSIIWNSVGDPSIFQDVVYTDISCETHFCTIEKFYWGSKDHIQPILWGLIGESDDVFVENLESFQIDITSGQILSPDGSHVGDACGVIYTENKIQIDELAQQQRNLFFTLNKDPDDPNYSNNLKLYLELLQKSKEITRSCYGYTEGLFFYNFRMSLDGSSALIE